jgi:hypothetical protein
MAQTPDKLAKLIAEAVKPNGDAYTRHKARAAERQSKLSRQGRDIAPLPKVVDPARKEAGRTSLEVFGKTYFPNTFRLPFCDDHRRAIKRIETSVIEGGLYALAMPRGSGKTSLCLVACIWAIAYGYRSYVVLISATSKLAANSLKIIKCEIEANDLLLEDFPEICYPVRRLERVVNRCKGQLFSGQPVCMSWTDNEIVMPTIPGSKASGAILRSCGITASIRGLIHKKSSGETIRPDLVVVDDPQTRASATSPHQCAARELLISGDILGLAGPGRKIAGIMPCTVIRQGDMVDCALDRNKHPRWNGERTKMVYAFPAAEKLWEEYAEKRREGMRQGDDGRDATEFYRQHQAEMDAGAVVAWPERHNDDELSGLQHAMNLRIDDETTFLAEYQNEPQSPAADDLSMLTAGQIAEKTNGMAPGQVPLWANHLTMFVDVHDNLLFWAVCAWSSTFRGAVVSYGTCPEQQLTNFTLRKATPTLAEVAPPGSGREASIRAGLDSLISGLVGQEWKKEGGQVARIEKCLIDCGYERDLVFDICRHHVQANVLLPSRGVGLGARKAPMAEWAPREGERQGWNWVLAPTRNRAGRYVRFDTHHWKSFVHARLAVQLGDTGCLSLFGHQSADHRLFAEHLVAESAQLVTADGRTVAEWSMRPGISENHWLDCVVGNAVAASICGAALPDCGMPLPKPPRPRLSLQEMRDRARAKQAG